MIKPLIGIAIIIVIVLLASNLITGQLSSFRLISSQGNIVSPPNIGIYWNSNGTKPVSNITWGSVEIGSTKNVTVHIRNEGNEKVNLSLNTTNWDPPNASDFITLSWDYPQGSVISPQQIFKVTLTLSIAPTTHGIIDFQFDIIIGVNG